MINNKLYVVTLVVHAVKRLKTIVMLTIGVT